MLELWQQRELTITVLLFSISRQHKLTKLFYELEAADIPGHCTLKQSQNA